MFRFRLADLPDGLREQAERQLTPASRNRNAGASVPKRDGVPNRNTNKSDEVQTDSKEIGGLGETDYHPQKVKRLKAVVNRGTPNKTEAEYNARFLDGKGRYEAVTLHLPGGNYTPDWMTDEDGVLTLTEVKGAFRFGSQSRAILAFKEAASLFPFWRFVWATKKKGGVWDIKQYTAGMTDNSEED